MVTEDLNGAQVAERRQNDGAGAQMQLAALAHTEATQEKPTEAVMEPIEQETATTKHATAAAVEEAEA